MVLPLCEHPARAHPDEHGLRLDCVGYFRKQDLTLWWPVNIAELRRIQSRVLDLGPIDKVRPGHLVTIAAEAIHDDVLPKLAGTAVDRPSIFVRMT
jgi:hypothetical protein